MLRSRLAAWDLQKFCSITSVIRRNFAASHNLLSSAPSPSDSKLTDDKNPKKKDAVRAKTPIGNQISLDLGSWFYTCHGSHYTVICLNVVLVCKVFVEEILCIMLQVNWTN